MLTSHCCPHLQHHRILTPRRQHLQSQLLPLGSILQHFQGHYGRGVEAAQSLHQPVAICGLPQPFTVACHPWWQAFLCHLWRLRLKRAKVCVSLSQNPTCFAQKLCQQQEKQMGTTEKSSIKSDVETRWHSTLCIWCSLLPHLKPDLAMTLADVEGAKIEFSAQDWTLMEKVVKVLRSFEEVMKLLWCKDATITRAIPAVSAIVKTLETNPENRGIMGMKWSLQESMERRHADIESINHFTLPPSLIADITVTFSANQGLSSWQSRNWQQDRECLEKRVKVPRKPRKWSPCQKMHHSPAWRAGKKSKERRLYCLQLKAQLISLPLLQIQRSYSALEVCCPQPWPSWKEAV